MVKNNNEILQYDQVEEATVPRFATEEEILASFGYKQVLFVAYICQPTCILTPFLLALGNAQDNVYHF